MLNPMTLASYQDTDLAFLRIFRHGIFISRPRQGQVYVAHRSYRSTKLIWYILPYEPTGPYVRIEANRVSRSIRSQAYKYLDDHD